MPDTATQVLEDATPRRELVGENLRAGADWFHENEGDLFERDEALESLQSELDVDDETASAILAELAGDTVDPIVHITSKGTKYYGVIEYEEFDGAYGYVDYHDVLGERKRVVCAQCVQDSTMDTDVAHATAGDPSGAFSEQNEASYEELLKAVHSHYNASHSIQPDEIQTGASLVSGTTIGGNTAYHSGNFSGYSDSDASDAAPVQTVNGETGDITISGFSGSHNDLTDVGASDHHSRYTDSEALTAFESGDAISHPSYNTESDPPTLDAGDVFYVTDDGLYVENTYNGTISEDPTPLDGHASDTTNPHNVTASQTGAVINTTEVNSANWSDYEIQKNGTDETGIINFKT